MHATQSSRTPAWLPFAVVGLLAAIGIVAFLILTGGTDEPEPSPTATASPSPTAEPSPSPTFNEALLNERLTVLFVGTDVNEARAGRDEPVNTDALLLVSVSADQSEVVEISLPRDTVDVPLPDGGAWQLKINGLYREQGIDALVGAMETLYAAEIEGHVLLDMDDFAELVEGVGGITVSPEGPLDDAPIGLDLDAGEQEIDGETALSYVRTRVDTDYGRMGRHQEAMVALMQAVTDADAELDLPSLLEGLESLETDLPLDDLPTLLEIVRRAQDAEIRQLVIGPPEFLVFEGDRGDGRGYIIQIDVEAVRAEVQELITDAG
ncbi:MAG: LCP family protein [Candidatus Limnocylindria bacterium]